MQSFAQDAASVQDGEALFKANCASCHAVKEKLVGPALKGIETRRPEDWLLKWIKNSSAVIKSGDDYAVKIYNEYNKVAMPSFNLKDAEIKSVLAYVKAEAEKPDAVPAAGTGAPGAAPESEGGPVGLYLILAIVVLYVLVVILGRVQSTLERTVRQRDGLPEPVEVPRKEATIHWIRNNKKIVAVMLLL